MSLKTTTALFTAQAAGATSPVINCAADDGRDISGTLIVGAGVTVSPNVTPQWSHDGTRYFNGPTYAPPIAAGTYTITIQTPLGIKAFRLAYVAQTTGTSQADFDITQVGV